ncbi:ubiquitin-like-conjugating enzyme ATG10 isoform X2 [Eurytemora carolleeae]|uniref:ubiquitin-like-conjugating enzyme ATG10 isoform X2 n=1 Tax=Eurytemora carolleeae TaxID=1294199 RepID=UPI000C778629|nr:ubiquitin-like-conjugating enzyme ATG10 isoform X2 [Eurytemora carolleeae]|eukprot:XP_023332738.1 ubiquitin-like-conjugating enzyme ATG10 isoform X2 [Eurytemora affinis]
MGTLSYQRFVEEGEDLVKKMSKNGEKNICYVNGDREEGGYLKIERLLVVSASKQENKEIHEDSECFDASVIEEDENSVEINGKRENKDYLGAEYQVHYSAAYSVPLFLARFYTSSGQTLPLDKELGLKLDRFSLNEISVSPHPLEDTPWIQIHPCKTGSIMAQIMLQNELGNYLIGFLSFYGQSLGLILDPKLAKV